MEILGQVGLPLIALAVMLFGLVSVIFIPILPSLVIMWAAAGVFAIIDGLNTTSGILFAIITVLMIIGSTVDNLFMGASARKTGASWTTITIALVAGLAGSIAWPPLGGIIVSLIALFGLEYLRVHDWRKAFDSTRSMAVGCGWAVVARFGIGVVMVALFAGWVFFAR